MKKMLNNGWLLLEVFPVSLLIYSFATGRSLLEYTSLNGDVILERVALVTIILGIGVLSWVTGKNDTIQ
jgi:hypothetical protein